MDGFSMRSLRKQCGLKIYEVAAELGVSVRSVNRWENSRCRIKEKIENKFLEIVTDLKNIERIVSNRKNSVDNVS